MIPQDRRRKILKLLDKNNYMSVEDLAEQLYTSVPTARRDLAQLDKEGVVRRVHGGAYSVKDELIEGPFDIRSHQQMSEKRKIGAIAADLLEDGDHVFLDTGSTCYAMVEMLDPSLRLTVVSNCLPTVQALSKKNDIKVEIPCGSYEPVHASISGDETVRFIETRHAQYYFASGAGLDAGMGVNARVQSDIAVKQAMSRQAEKTVLLMDHTKMQDCYFYKVLDFKDLDMIISDRALPEDIQEQCDRWGVEVLHP